MKEEKQIIEELPMELVPMDPSALADLDYDRAQIAHSIQERKENISRMAKMAIKLDSYDARKIDSVVQVDNIKKIGMEISNYLGIVEMLLDNMNSDLRHIYQQRKLFARNYALHLAKIEEEQKQQMRREKEATRIAEKRAMEDPEIKKIQEKKYQRPT